MRIAVLMSTYNGEKYIQQQIVSILNQKGEFDVDLIVRDDGSSDSTQDILEMYGTNGKLKWYRGQNLKPAQSFMDLLYRTHGYDYYAFADQDDYWMEDKIQRGVDRIANEKVPALYCSNAVLVDADLRDLGRNVFRRGVPENLYSAMCASNAMGCTMIFNSSLAEIITKREKAYAVAMHDSFMARVCYAVGGKVIFDSRVTMLYRQHGNNVIGVRTGVLGKIRNRIAGVLKKAPITIDEQAKEIIRLYSDVIPVENMRCLRQIAEYRENVGNRVSLALSNKTHYTFWYVGLQMRLSILLGNR